MGVTEAVVVGSLKNGRPSAHMAPIVVMGGLTFELGPLYHLYFNKMLKNTPGGGGLRGSSTGVLLKGGQMSTPGLCKGLPKVTDWGFGLL